MLNVLADIQRSRLGRRGPARTISSVYGTSSPIIDHHADDADMAYLGPDEIYVLALRAIKRVTTKYPVADGVAFARLLVALSFQESCLNKGATDQKCFDTEARPRDAKGRLKSSAYGLTQVMEGTQRNIERFMKWPKRPLEDRSNPQYAMELSAAYMAYLYNGGDKTPSGDWYKTLVAYHDGHYSKGGVGHSYAKTVMGFLKRFDFAGIVKRLGSDVAMLEFDNRAEFR